MTQLYQIENCSMTVRKDIDVNNDNSDNNSNRSGKFAYSSEFAHFLCALDDFLAAEGWHINGRRILVRRLSSIDAVEKYLNDHCYDREESLEIVQKLWSEIMSEPMKEFWERGYNDYWNGIEQNNCPTWSNIEKRNAWNDGWIFAQWADSITNEITNENLPTTD